MLQGEIGRNTLEQQARTGERLRSAGFSQASKLAQDAATQQLRQAQLTGGCRKGLAGGLAQLGMQGQQMAGQDINTLLGIGGLQQQQAQQGLNVAQANALAQQQLPFQQLGFLGDIFRGVPALQQQTTQTYTPPPSILSQGIGLLGAGLYGGFFNSPTAVGRSRTMMRRPLDRRMFMNPQQRRGMARMPQGILASGPRIMNAAECNSKHPFAWLTAEVCKPAWACPGRTF